MRGAAAAATLLGIVLAALWLLQWRRKSRCKLPGGSTGWPLIGETLSFLKPHPAFHVSGFMAHRIARYGKVFKTHLYGSPTIVTVDPELNRLILRNQFLQPSAVKLLGKNSILVQAGDAHHELRSKIHKFLSPSRMSTMFLDDAQRVAELVFESWKDKSTVLAKHEATKFTMNITAMTLMGWAYGDSRVEKWAKEFHSYMQGFVSIPLNLPGFNYRKALQSRRSMIGMIKQEISKRKLNKVKEIPKQDNQEDFLGWLMANTDYTDEEIGDTILALILAGNHTTQTNITASIYLLHHCPEALQQLRDEHISFYKSKKEGEGYKLTWEDFKEMKFTQCVINETLRMTNIIPFSLRRAAADVKIKDLEIPRGYNVLAHFGAPHLDGNLFEDPLKFSPWRWSGSSFSNTPSYFMPFGGGNRLCPGAELARLEMSVFLHHLVLNYRWRICEIDNPIVVLFIDFTRGFPINVEALSSF